MVQAVPKDVLEKSILPQIPIGRLGEPEEIARCVVFLASDGAGLITGSTLTAHGGQYFVLVFWGLFPLFGAPKQFLPRGRSPASLSFQSFIRFLRRMSIRAARTFSTRLPAHAPFVTAATLFRRRSARRAKELRCSTR